MRKRLAVVMTICSLSFVLVPVDARSQSLENATDVPVFARAVPNGAGTLVTTPGAGLSPKVVDGALDDWTGTISRYGGRVVYSNGEVVYQDHLFDAHGADDGRDADRMAIFDPLADAVPETYRLDPLAQADAPGEFGAPMPDEFSYNDSFGDASPHQDASDIEEVRVALTEDALHLLVRTTTMTAANQTGVLLLADTADGAAQQVPFNAAVATDIGDHAVFLSGAAGRAADLASGVIQELPAGSVATQPEGFTNAIEARIPLTALGGVTPRSIAVATGLAGENGFANLALELPRGATYPNLANVAFRTGEPVQVWFDKRQALALNAGTIDEFFLPLDTTKLASDITETFIPGHGYHDRIFISESTPQVVKEAGIHGRFQHYGVYLPEAYDGSEALPLQWWLHWRGGRAHTAGSVIPRMFKHFGEEQDTIVVSPSGRGTSTWYVWNGHVDFLEVWDDVTSTFEVDLERVYTSGHSMGGFGSYLLTVLYPDRFAAAAPVAGPVTQGAWTGLDFDGCDEFEFDGSTPCYISANNSRPRDQHTRKLLDNVRHVPYAILHGTNDELVPYSGVVRQAERLRELNYRHRLYSYPGYEHYSHPIVDQWSEAASYMHRFVSPVDPSRVTYKRDMLFERATEEVQAPAGAFASFDFDSAYWMSNLTPADPQAGIASFDGRSHAIPEQPRLEGPDAAGPATTGTTGPYIAVGIQWLNHPTALVPEPRNEFGATLTGASAVTLDVDRMKLDVGQPITGSVTTALPLALSLDGSWPQAPDVTVDGSAVATTFEDGVVSIDIPSGTHALQITPGQGSPEPTETATPTPTEAGPSDTSLQFTDTPSTGQFSDEVTFNARLTDADGLAVAGENVVFELVTSEGRRSFEDTTDGDGIATITTRLTERPGDAQVFASFAGNDDYASSGDVIASYLIAKEDSSLGLQVQGKGSKRTLIATLTEDDGAIAGRTIEFAADADAICRPAPTTDGNGRAACDVPARYQGGKHAYAAVFPGDDYYVTSRAS